MLAAHKLINFFDGVAKKDNAEIYVNDIFNAGFEDMSIKKFDRTRAYVKIEDGCENRCSYCIIPSARGKVRSKAPHKIIAEVEELTKNGCKEIVLTGIETGAYGRDFDNGYRLCDLIRELDERKSCERIRLGSLTPELCGADFVNGIKGCAILAPHFHLSLQSGSDAVLFAMRRRYSAARAMENVERLREAFPNANFTTDIMVGFPGESDEDFLKTLQFVKQARFLDVHVFSYSQRKGTDAAEMCGQIPPEVKRRRSEQLMQLKCEVRDSILDGIISSSAPLSVVCESRAGDFYLAHSDSFVEVRFSHHDGIDPVGEICKVRPVSHKDGVISAELIEICK
jgi:threonylcarbamoyladenosine tRNA methylthiotransferase MtaB